MRPTILTSLIPLTLLLLGAPATAAVHAGNPHLDVVLTVPGQSVSSAEVDVEDLVMVACDSTETVIAIDDTVDLAAGLQTAIPAGDWCGVRLTGLVWDEATGSGQGGSWALAIDHDDVFIDIDPGDGTLALQQYTVVQGAVHAGNPHLEVFID